MVRMKNEQKFQNGPIIISKHFILKIFYLPGVNQENEKEGIENRTSVKDFAELESETKKNEIHGEEQKPVCDHSEALITHDHLHVNNMTEELKKECEGTGRAEVTAEKMESKDVGNITEPKECDHIQRGEQMGNSQVAGDFHEGKKSAAVGENERPASRPTSSASKKAAAAALGTFQSNTSFCFQICKFLDIL